MKLVTAACLLAALVTGCSDDVTTRSFPHRDWNEEKLQDGMAISFPQGYVGRGYWCMVDACYFEKAKVDSTVVFHFPMGDMTGNRPAEFDDLPEQFRYLHRELITTDDGLKGALYYTLEHEHSCEWSQGTFLIEKADASGFCEVVWVAYDELQHAHVAEVASTIKYTAE